MLSRLFTAVQTEPSGATARPVPLRTPVAKGAAGPPLGGIRMMAARGGLAVRSPAVMLPVEPMEKYTAPSLPTATLFSACAYAPPRSGLRASGRPAAAVRRLVAVPLA